MRVLVTAVPQDGHLFALLPLARAFAEQGDDVVVGVAADAATAAGAAGLRTTTVGHGLGDWWQTLAARTRGRPGDGLPMDRVLRYFTARLFAEIGADDMVDDLLRLAREHRPDVVVADPYALAAPLVANLVGATYVHQSLGPAIDAAVLDVASDAVSPLWRAFGADVPAHAGVYSGITVDICPSRLNAPHPPGVDVRPLRPTPLALGGKDELPVGLRDLPDRPTVYVTLGTLSNSDTNVFRAVLDGLADEPLNVVVTVGPNNDPSMVGPLPANAYVERFVPQSLLLPSCAAVVHHAGSGTMFGALAYGLPQVAIPQGADNFVNAELLAGAGVARRLLPGDVDASAVRRSVREVLDDSAYRQAAQHVAEEIAQMPTPAQLAADLRSYVAELRSNATELRSNASG
jgi:UDP:flavonoid glycosyltransferase YjiC (YdhE family)